MDLLACQGSRAALAGLVKGAAILAEYAQQGNRSVAIVCGVTRNYALSRW
jgi:hypothetical protein